MKRVGKEFFLQHDIVIMYSIYLFYHYFKMQFSHGSVCYPVCLVLFYTLNEYDTPVLFHLKPPKTYFIKMLRRLHYDHHVYPDDLKLYFTCMV